MKMEMLRQLTKAIHALRAAEEAASTTTGPVVPGEQGQQAILALRDDVLALRQALS